MLNAYGLLWLNWWRYFGWQLRNLFRDGAARVPRNVAIALLVLPAFLVLQQWNWLCLLIDELLFFRYRRVTISRPLFIVGVPRSGTTFLQRTLAADPQFTTTTLQECLFAPSITQRYLLRGAHCALQPLSQGLNTVFRGFGQRMQSIHSLALEEAEEDFLLLLPVMASFVQMALFPRHPLCWQLSAFDQRLPLWQRRIVREFYRRMLQRHLWFHGINRVYLSKNPSFTTMIGSLREDYPDATIIACVRPPEQAVPSQLSSLKPAFELLGHDIAEGDFQRSIIEMLTCYYREIDRHSTQNSVRVVEQNELRAQLFECIYHIYHLGGYALTPTLAAIYRDAADRNVNFRSAHRYAEESQRGYRSPDFRDCWPLSGQGRLLDSTD